LRIALRLHPALFAAALAVGALSIAIIRRAFPLGIPGEWTWQYRDVIAPWVGAALPVFFFVLVVSGCVFFGEKADLQRLGTGGRAFGLALAVLFAFGIRCGMQSLLPKGKPAPDDAAMIVISPVATSYFCESQAIDSAPGGVREFMRTFPERMVHFEYHAQTHPPGTLLLFWVVRKTLSNPKIARITLNSGLFPEVGDKQLYVDRSWKRKLPYPEILAAEVVARLMPLAGTFFLIPFFFLCRHLWGESTAWRMLMLGATVPGLLVFFPAIDQVYVLVTTCALWHFTKGLDARSARPFLLSGLWFGVGLMMTLAVLTLLVTVVVLTAGTALAARRQAPNRTAHTRHPWALFSAFLAGLLFPILTGRWLLGIDFVAIVKTALSAHGDVTTVAFKRTYWKWLIVNLIDFGGALGVTWMVWCAWAATRLSLRSDGQRSLLSDSVPTGKTVTPTLLLIAWAATVLLLDVSGVVRAEVARIWMFLLPVGVALCGPVLIAHGNNKQAAEAERGRQEMIAHATMNVHYAVLAGLQLVQAIVLHHEVIFIRFY